MEQSDEDSTLTQVPLPSVLPSDGGGPCRGGGDLVQTAIFLAVYILSCQSLYCMFSISLAFFW